MRSREFPKRMALTLHTAASHEPMVVAGAAFASDDHYLRVPVIFRLPAIWRQRARFRAQLRADLIDNADLLHDIGIELHDAQAEVWRFFWEPILLKRR